MCVKIPSFGGELYMVSCDKSFNDLIKLDLSAYCLWPREWASSEVFSLAANQSPLLGSSTPIISAVIYNCWPLWATHRMFLLEDLLSLPNEVERFYKSKLLWHLVNKSSPLWPNQTNTGGCCDSTHVVFKGVYLNFNGFLMAKINWNGKLEFLTWPGCCLREISNNVLECFHK